MRKEDFDVVIVGSGTAAQTALAALAGSGRRIAVVAPPPLGGVCSLTGCQPKKYLAAHAEARGRVRDLLGRGFETMPHSSWAQLQALKNAFTGSVPERTRRHIEKSAALIDGRAVFVSPSQLRVGDTLLSAERILLATGSVPRRSGIPGSEHLGTSDDFLDLQSLPERLLFIGGGVIAFEFAHVAAALGSRVTILHRSERLLKGFDAEAVQRFLEHSASAGIEVVTEAPVARVVKEERGVAAVTEAGERFRADAIFETIGRKADLSVLDGDLGGVDATGKGIKVNAFMQSVSNPRVYAAGDCTETPYRLATVADAQGRTAALNMLGRNAEAMDYTLVPAALYAHPPLVTVGLTEAEAEAGGLSYEVHRGETAPWPSSRRLGEEAGFYKMVVGSDGVLLGATLLRHSAPDVINLCALAIRTKTKAEELKTMLMAYPTATSDLKYMLG
ncbi:MAG: NAD(P)/FAD-dependent oxidoreductase [Campylobacterales bacterium]